MKQRSQRRNQQDLHLPGQANEHVFPHLTFAPKWFISLGPANATEFLEARDWWPGIKLLGLEPSRAGFSEASSRWPKDGILLQAAAWESDGELTLHKSDDLLHGTCFADWNAAFAQDASGDYVDCPKVVARSLDSLDLEYGPFRDAILWADVEGAERSVLRGAKGLLVRKAIGAINLEVRPHYADELAEFLSGFGFHKVREYFACETYRDEVWHL